MKNSHILIIALIAIVISFFLGRSYQAFKFIEDNKPKIQMDTVLIKSPVEQKELEVKEIISEPKIEKSKISTIKSDIVKSTSKSKNIIKFISTYNDFENSTDILETNYEISYHTFDFDNKTVTMELKQKNGGWKVATFKWKKVKEPYNNGYVEFDIVNDKGVYQIWRSSMSNIGYEFYNNTKLVFYGIQRVN